ncbi:MAG: FtsX-like permease family protein, partial [Acidobacteria bacterium]|nr:FtsX-like permease family protein [Acidobacteriota bacterium]
MRTKPAVNSSGPDMVTTQDLRYSFRLIREHPWFSAAIIVTIALGIGVNTTIFTLVNAVLFKPLPFPGGERIRMIGASQTAQGRNFFPVSYADIADVRAGASRGFERIEAVSETRFSVTEKANPPEQFRGAWVTAGLFDLIQTRPALGRGFTSSDEAPNAQQTALIGYGVWKDRYGSDPAVIGRVVRLNDRPAEIIGVMPDGFKFPQGQDVWAVTIPTAERLRRGQRDFMIVAMQRPEIGREGAQAELDVVATRLAGQFPDSHKDHQLKSQTFHETMNGGPIRLVFLLMLGAVGFVLLIACANVANMLLSRAVGRTREIGIRSALGATRGRIVRQLLVESLVLSVTGGLAGLALSQFGISAFDKAVANVGKPYWIQFTMNWTVVAYFAAICVLSGLIFGLAPALRASRVDLNET